MSRSFPIVLVTLVAAVMVYWFRNEVGSSGADVLGTLPAETPALDGGGQARETVRSIATKNARDPIEESHAVDAEELLPPRDEVQEEVLWEEIEDEGDDSDWLAQVGLSADTPLALRLGRGGPPDPVEQGDMTLELRLFNSESGEPFSSEVILWRIDAEPNRFWTRGDQGIARNFVGEDGLRFEGLLAGRYRPVVLGEWRHAPHQAEIEVWGDVREDLSVEAPRSRSAFLKLKTAAHTLPSVEVSIDHISSRDHSRDVPTWVTGRTIQSEFSYGFFSSMVGDPNFYLERVWTWLYPDQGLYSLRDLPEDARGAYFYADVLLRFDGSTPRQLRIENPGQEPKRLARLVFEMAPE